MSDQTNEATLVLNQLRASLDGNRYSLSAVYAALALAFGGSAIVLIIVLILWQKLKEIYASRPNMHYELSRTSKGFDALDSEKPKMSSCIRKTWNTTEADLQEDVGLDAAIYMRTLRMVFLIFVVLTVLLFGTAAPINIVYNLRTKYVTNLTKRDALMLLTPSLLTSSQMIPHVVLGWVANIVVFGILWFNHVRVLAMRTYKYSSPDFQANVTHRTAMIVDLPKSSRSSEGIKRVLSHANPRVPPYRVMMSQNINHIHDLVEQYEKLVLVYERKMTSRDKNEAFKIRGELDTLASIIQDKRSLEVGTMNTYGFGVYTMVKDVFSAAKKKQEIPVRVAPPPDQLIWSNMKLTPAERGTKQLIINALYGLLLVLWVVPSAFIGCFLSNLTRLGAVWPAFGAAIDTNPTGFAILQGILAPAVTTLVFAWLPSLFRRFSHLEGEVTRIDREKEVLRKLYSFFFIDNYFIFSFIGVVWDIVAQVLQQTESTQSQGGKLTFKEVWTTMRIADRLATAIVNISSFWVMYLLKGILELFLTFAQPIELLKRMMRFLNFMRKRTPREQAENIVPQPFQYAVNYLNVLFYATVALGFTTIQPLVLPAALLYFGLSIPLKKYELVNMKRTNYESNGLYWPLVVNLLLFALGFGNLMLLCVVWVQSGWKVAAGAIPLAPTVVIFKVVTSLRFNAPYVYPDTNESGLVVSTSDVKPEVVERDLLLYQDPVYYGDLMQPLLSLNDAFKTAYAKCNGTSGKYDDFTMPHTFATQFDYDDESYKYLQGSARRESEGSLQSGDEYEYNVGAVARYINDNTPYTPVEPYPVYQSDEGRVPQLNTESFADDEQRLL